MPDTSTTARELALGLPVAVIAGALVGTLGTFKHQYGVSPTSGAGFPTGLLLALAMVAVFLVALRLTFPSRWYAVAAAAGVLAAVLVLWMKGPGGSVVILRTSQGDVWLVGSLLIAGAVAALPAPRRRLRDRRRPDGILEDDPTGDAAVPIETVRRPSVHDPAGEDR